MNKPKITVVTVCYNAVKEIERTMLSVLNQTYPNVEYIIIDGKSTDGTVDVIKKYADRLAYFVSEPDKGIYDAMNKGIEHASGEWINFLNAGDVYCSSSVLDTMNKNIDSDIRILRGNIFRVYPKMKVKSVGVTKQNPDIIDMFNGTFHHQACLIQTSLFHEIGLYSTEYRLVSDWKFFFDCVVLNKVKTKYVDITVALFDMTGASSVNTKKCTDESEHYLRHVYGDELYELLDELSIYRKSSIIKKYYNIRKNFFSHLSPEMFNRLLTIKRYVWHLLGKKVN